MIKWSQTIKCNSSTNWASLVLVVSSIYCPPPRRSPVNQASLKVPLYMDSNNTIVLPIYVWYLLLLLKSRWTPFSCFSSDVCLYLWFDFCLLVCLCYLNFDIYFGGKSPFSSYLWGSVLVHTMTYGHRVPAEPFHRCVRMEPLLTDFLMHSMKEKSKHILNYEWCLGFQIFAITCWSTFIKVVFQTSRKYFKVIESYTLFMNIINTIVSLMEAAQLSKIKVKI